MNLIEAIKSGRPFRSVGSGSESWLCYSNNEIRYQDTKGLFHLCIKHLLLDYELQEPTQTITRKQLLEVLGATFDDNAAFTVITSDRLYNGRSRLSKWLVEHMAEKLGLGET